MRNLADNFASAPCADTSHSHDFRGSGILGVSDILSAETPLHLPHLIGPMQHYLWILKTTHSGADMDTSMEMAKGALDDGLRWTIYDILKNR